MQNTIKQLVQQPYGGTLDVQIVKQDEKILSAILSEKIKTDNKFKNIIIEE